MEGCTWASVHPVTAKFWHDAGSVHPVDRRFDAKGCRRVASDGAGDAPRLSPSIQLWLDGPLDLRASSQNRISAGSPERSPRQCRRARGRPMPFAASAPALS